MEALVLWQKPDPLSNFYITQGTIKEVSNPTGRENDGNQNLDKCRFPSPIGPQEAEYFSRFNLKGYMAQGLRFTPADKP
jgi:hypothetical protein